MNNFSHRSEFISAQPTGAPFEIQIEWIIKEHTGSATGRERYKSVLNEHVDLTLYKTYGTMNF